MLDFDSWMSAQGSRCPCCGEVAEVKVWDRITSFHDDEDNRLECCRTCIDADDEYYAERWAEYYNGQGFGSCKPKDFIPDRGTDSE